MNEAFAALLDANDRVTSVIVVDADDLIPAPSGTTLVVLDEGLRVGIGWMYDGNEWTSPFPSEPDPGEETPPTLEALVAQMQEVIDGQSGQIAIQQAQLDNLIDYIMMSG